MNDERALSGASRVVVLGLVVGAVGVVIQIASGVDYPAVPPGLFILLVPAGLVALGRWRWAPILAVVAALFIAAGYFLSGTVVRLLDPGEPGVFFGLWLQFIAAIVTVIAGIRAIVQDHRLLPRHEETRTREG